MKVEAKAYYWTLNIPACNLEEHEWRPIDKDQPRITQCLLCGTMCLVLTDQEHPYLVVAREGEETIPLRSPHVSN